MNIKEIVKDSVRYPFSDWNKFLIFGIIVLFSNLASINLLLGSNFTILILLSIIGLVVSFLARGYQFRIIKSSLTGRGELPKFNTWIEMFLDGIKVFIVGIVYLIPAILMILFFANFTSALKITNPPIYVFHLFGAAILTIFGLPKGNALVAGPEVSVFILLLYTIIILPISLVAIANMANNDSKLSTAFKFREIINKIANKGWMNFIIWYIVTGIVFEIVFGIGNALGNIFRLSGVILASLTVIAYVFLYLYRSIALFYMSK
jgi:hypothetical protein